MEDTRMAKTYIKPETKTYKVELQQICQVSNKPLDPNDPDPITDPNEIGARGFGFFEEEEEE